MYNLRMYYRLWTILDTILWQLVKIDCFIIPKEWLVPVTTPPPPSSKRVRVCNDWSAVASHLPRGRLKAVDLGHNATVSNWRLQQLNRCDFNVHHLKNNVHQCSPISTALNLAPQSFFPRNLKVGLWTGRTSQVYPGAVDSASFALNKTSHSSWRAKQQLICKRTTCC